MGMEKIFEISDLNVKFPLGEGFFSKEKGFIHAVNGVSLDVYKNEIIAIVGESGCGKSTFVKTIMGLEAKTSGSVIFNGKNLDDFKKDDMKNFRKKCQMVFQNPFSSLNPRMNVFDILKEPLIVSGVKSKKQINEKIFEVLELVGLDKSVIKRFPHEFSGGQRQRIAIARALILEPEVIVADEPVSALDVSIQAQIINLLLELKQKLSLTIIFISHDLSVVKHVSDRVAVMYLGEIIELADKKSLFENPIHPYTQALLSAVPTVSAKKYKSKTLDGDLPSVKNLPEGCFFASRCSQAKPICAVKHPKCIQISPTHKVACLYLNE